MCDDDEPAEKQTGVRRSRRAPMCQVLCESFAENVVARRANRRSNSVRTEFGTSFVPMSRATRPLTLGTNLVPAPARMLARPGGIAPFASNTPTACRHQSSASRR